MVKYPREPGDADPRSMLWCLLPAADSKTNQEMMFSTNEGYIGLPCSGTGNQVW